MNLQLISSTDKIYVKSNNLYPQAVPSPKLIWYKYQIIRFEMQKNQQGKFYIDVLMVGTNSWQLDNDGNGLGLPVSEINGEDVSTKSNSELMDYLFNL